MNRRGGVRGNSTRGSIRGNMRGGVRGSMRGGNIRRGSTHNGTITTNEPAVDICAFLNELHMTNNDADTKYERIGKLIAICNKYHLRMHQEKVVVEDDVGDDTNDAEHTKPQHAVRRVIISADRFDTSSRHPVSFQCNGLVLDSDTWEVLSYPAPTCKVVYNKKTLISGIENNKYEIYRVRDGTVITLYWYENAWCMSSANGFQINHYKWMGETTYEEAFIELMARYPGFSFDNLDKSHCYTLGFRYHDFHPFVRDPESIWFIQSCDLNALNGKSDDADNAASSVDTATATFPRALNVITSAASTVRPEVKMLERQISVLVGAKDAAQFIKSVETDCNTSLDNVLRDRECSDFTYGFLFRDPTSTYGIHSHVIIESALMKTLRRMLYNFNDTHRDERLTVNNTNRLNYILVRSYINYSQRAKFISLMPQFTVQYDSFNKTVDMVVSRVIQQLRVKGGKGGVKNAKMDTAKNTMFDLTVSSLTAYVTKHCRVNMSDMNTKSIIYDLVVSPKFLHMYYALLIQNE